MEFEVIELSSGPIKTPDSITTQSITWIIKLLGNSLDPPCYQCGDHKSTVPCTKCPKLQINNNCGNIFTIFTNYIAIIYNFSQIDIPLTNYY